MKLTYRGAAASFAGIALASAALAFRDLLLGFVLFAALLVIASEAVWVGVATKRPDSRIRLSRVEPGKGVGKPILYPGDESVEKVHLVKRIGGRVGFESSLAFQAINPKVVGSEVRDSTLEFRFTTPYAGEYSGRNVRVGLTGPLGLFSAKTSVPFAQNFKVHPRLSPVAATAIRLLGRGELGETPVEIPGVGSEFYEMRRYQAGDDVRDVNWKATARQGYLTVSVHMREVGSSLLLVLDARATSFFDTDRLASTFLSVANSLASSGVKFGVLVHDGTRVTATSPEEDPGSSLRVALKSSLSITGLDSDPEFLELVPARRSAKLLPKDRAPEEPALERIKAIRRWEATSAMKSAEPWASASRCIRDSSTRSVIYVSGLFNELGSLIELAWQARRHRDVDFAVANPCQPWAVAETEDKARKLFAKYQSAAKALDASGIRYYRGEPINLARQILSA